jgi:small-conductance mechanosensitive channel
MIHAGINHLAILIAAVASWLVGALWYGLLGKAWAAALDSTGRGALDRSVQKSAVLFITAFLADLVIAYVLAGAIGHLGPGQVTIKNGVISAAILWLGFVATTGTVNNAFAGRKPSLTAIDAGHWLAAMLCAGATIGAMGTG